MTFEYERDAFDEAGDSGNGIEGQHLKCAKGKWLLDDAAIETGDRGVKLCVIFESASVGQVLWRNSKIADRNIGRMADGFCFPRQVAEDWNPYVAFQAVRADEGNLGDLLTFTSSSWGGWYAFQRLVNPWRLKGRRQFPIVVLDTKERNDENRNVDPVFKIVAWSARENFQELLLAQPTAAIAHSPNPVSRAVAELIDDSITF